MIQNKKNAKSSSYNHISLPFFTSNISFSLKYLLIVHLNRRCVNMEFVGGRKQKHFKIESNELSIYFTNILGQFIKDGSVSQIKVSYTL